MFRLEEISIPFHREWEAIFEQEIILPPQWRDKKYRRSFISTEVILHNSKKCVFRTKEGHGVQVQYFSRPFP